MLLVALLGLAAGPACAVLWPGGRAWRAALDGLSMTLVGGLCLLHLLPHAIEHGGFLAVAVAAATAAVPRLLHHSSPNSEQRWDLFLFAVLLLHTFTDGAALRLLSERGSAIGLAIAAHRLPVGLIVFVTAQNRCSPAGWRAIGLLSIATLGGFGLGGAIDLHGHHWVEGVMEAAVAGALLHIVFDGHGPSLPGDAHHHHNETPPDVAPAERGWSTLGALAGIALVALFTAAGTGSHALSHVTETAESFLSLALASAPSLLVGYLLAGLAAGLLAPVGTGWLAQGGRLSQAGRGLLFGLPLPVCSCGVQPLYATLARRGVPAAAALAFLLVTPAVGLDVVMLSVPLLGLPLTIARIVAVVGIALVVALAIGRAVPLASATLPAGEPQTRLVRGLRYGLVDLVDHTMPWILLGLMLAALAEPLLGHDLLYALPAPLQVVLLAVIGFPAYVCAAGATPLAAVAVHKGISAGAALAFAIVGPMVNVTTLSVLAALHGRRVALSLGVGVAVLAVASGWAVDAVGIQAPALLDVAPQPGPAPLAWAAAGVLAVLALASLVRQGPRGAVHQIAGPHPVQA